MNNLRIFPNRINSITLFFIISLTLGLAASFFSPQLLIIIIVSSVILVTFLVRVDWALVITILLLPSLNHFEYVNLISLGGLSINTRVATYFGITLLFSILILIKKFNIPKISFVYFFTAFCFYMLFSTVLLSPSIAIGLPSSTRYLGYLLAFILAFNIARKFFNNDYKCFYKYINVLMISSIIPVIFGLYQYFSKTALFFNGAYRVTGTYTVHVLAFALFLQLVGVLLYSIYLREISFNFYLIYFIAVSFVLLQTHSRLVIVTYIISLIIIDFFTGKKSRIFPITFITIISFFLEESIVNRLMSTLELDNSTNFRIFIHEIMLPLIPKSLLYGYGAGSFPIIFYQQTGIANVASHDEYLGIIIDLGLIGLVLYLSMQINLLNRLFRGVKIKKYRKFYLPLFLIYLNMNVFSVIQNPNYFFDVQLLMWSFIGLLLGLESRESKS